MTDSLGMCRGILPEYKPAYNVLVGVTGAKDWKLLTDTHQISTREAGKSSCAFFIKDFQTFEKAVDIAKVIHTAMPSVNIEMQLAPNGYVDKGDGPGSFKHRAKWETDSQYISQEGSTCVLLIDVQNIMRVLKW